MIDEQVWTFVFQETLERMRTSSIPAVAPDQAATSGRPFPGGDTEPGKRAPAQQRRNS